MEVIRNEYLEKLKSLKDVHYIKILTGVRRCGKSTLLSQYKDILIREFGINDNQVIDYDFNDKLIADKFN
jgi:predicted AAA+ superfamily ATPase